MTSRPDQITIDAPAKLNLGLEILRRRPDGYHDLATIFLTVGIVDRLSMTRDGQISLTCDDTSLAGGDNLALRAVHVLHDATGVDDGARISLTKRIPTAAGLGGASSDAAAALLAARDIWGLQLSDADLAAIGARLGSDVPFFLRGGCAAGRGRGDQLQPLPVPTGVWFVVVAPRLVIARKTPTLYAQLSPSDFSDGSRTSAQAARLLAGKGLDLTLLGNAFARPLYALVPELADLPATMREAGAPAVAITGAGPAHYAPVPDPNDAARIAARLRGRLGSRAAVLVAEPLPARPAPTQPL